MRRSGGKDRVRMGTVKKGLLVLFVLALTSPVARAAITGSSHDFSGHGWGTNEICVFCHTPHNAKTDPSIAGSPLWNHQLSTVDYTLYSSPTMNVSPLQPRGPSKLCLSCHDGTVATDSYGNRSGTHFISGPANLGTDLSNDHPISINWNHQTLSSSSNCSNCHSGGHHGGFVYVGLPFYGTSGQKYLECATCHEPHNKYPEYTRMLRMNLAGSAICLSCHGK